MSWSKIVLSGVVAGVVGNIYDFLMHAMVMGNTYSGLPEVFSQEQANPLFFLLISLCFWTAAAVLFGKTRGSWAAGFKGGATYGFYLGLVVAFTFFYDTLVVADFPYYLSWCWAAIALVGGVVGGAALGLVQKGS